MAEPVTWGQLGYSIDDPTTLEEYIEGVILNHNMDPSAHGQSSEAIYEHRSASQIDHANYSIYQISQNPATRVYRAVLTQGGEGDFATLQAAIDWANLYGGGIVYIKPGRYYLNDDIVLYPNITLQGEDAATTILDFNNTAHGIVQADLGGEDFYNVKIFDLSIWQSHNTSTGAIYLSVVSDIHIERCKFYANDNWDIFLNETDNSIVRDCTSYLSDGFCRTYYSTKTEITNNQCSNNSLHAVLIASGSHSIVTHNRVSDCGSFAIFVDAGSNFKIEGNTLLQCTAGGIEIGGAAAAQTGVISNNTIEPKDDTTTCGIEVRHNSGSIQIVGNQITASLANGIDCDDLSNSQITGNTISGYAYGIYLASGSNYNSITNNYLDGDTGDYYNGGSGNVFDNNT